MAAEMVDVVAEHCGSNARIAVDQCHYVGYKEFERAGWTIENGTELMEQARKIKGPDEIKAMRCSAHACQAAMYDMQQQMQPGMTERQIWAMLHAGNIARAGSGSKPRSWRQVPARTHGSKRRRRGWSRTATSWPTTPIWLAPTG